MTDLQIAHDSKAEVYRCSNDEYHADTTSWSHSQIETLLESPPLFYGRHISKAFPRKSSPELDIGSFFHEVLSNPAGLEDATVQIPESVLSNGAKRGNAWKEWKAEHAGKLLLKKEEALGVSRMVVSLLNHPKANWLLNSDGPQELSIRWEDADTGLMLRARPDKLVGYRDGVIAVDWKSTRAMTPRTFSLDEEVRGDFRRAIAELAASAAVDGRSS